jgi:hypothetical protein
MSDFLFFSHNFFVVSICCSLLSYISSAACHKLLPSAGLGAVTAMQDAVVLANCLYEMRGLSLDDIASALDDFKNERFAKVKAQYEASKTNARLIYGQVVYHASSSTEQPLLFHWFLFSLIVFCCLWWH